MTAEKHKEPRLDVLLRIGLLLLGLSGFPGGGAAAGLDAEWLLVDTSQLTLSVMQGETVVAVYTGISIGRDGTTRVKSVGDRRTPLGSYKLAAIRDSERFYRFLVLDYPSLGDATRAYHSGRIEAASLAAIRSAHERGRQPPASTPLGGHIGIHGIGTGDARVHEDYNWTDGCVALANEQIDDLVGRVRPGMTVVIR
ncbi:MAG: L,D-transpeptidase [Xanthomonadales bacterium]|nr:L,D-transpeptidase [Xanthomonadales bacterium]